MIGLGYILHLTEGTREGMIIECGMSSKMKCSPTRTLWFIGWFVWNIESTHWLCGMEGIALIIK